MPGTWDGTSTAFLEILARKGGRLLKGGEADLDGVAKMVLNDFMRGKIPWFTPLPPKEDGDHDDDAELEGRRGKLGEMRKRKVEDDEDATTVAATDAGESTIEEEQDEDDDAEEWGGISDSDNEGSLAAPTLVGDSGPESEVESESEPEVEEVKPKPQNPKKRRKQ